MKRLYFLILLPLLLLSCSKDETVINEKARQDMRDFVQNLSSWSKAKKPSFLIIPQNGHDLMSLNGEPEGSPALAYLDAIDGAGQEDLYYGYGDNGDDRATPQEDKEWLEGFLAIGVSYGVTPLITNYCSTPSKMDDAYRKSSKKGWPSFSADQRELNNIPSYPSPIFHKNSDIVTSLSEVQNFLYLLDTKNYSSKKAFIDSLAKTEYDLFIIDAYYQDELLTSTDVAKLQTKPNGSKRLVVAYMSIGEAEEYRPYWQVGWKPGNPSWLSDENPDWPGNYKVLYWEKEWQDIIFGSDSSYLGKIIVAGFDGAYLDIIEAFEHFEEN